MKSNRIFGEINDVLEGDIFENRYDLSQKKVHKPIQAGISGSELEGADSIVVSGGYEDDEDLGDLIIYTGQGGRSEGSKLQVADQTLARGNKALAISFEKNLPVRVIRGATKHSKFAPKFGYRYDGIYFITDYWQEKGKSGFKIWRYRLEKRKPLILAADYQVNPEDFIFESIISDKVSNRKLYLLNKIIREAKIANGIKKLYSNKCQICGMQMKTAVSEYSEAAHIKGLGKPHYGPDSTDNILCLCPNHHVMLDLGMISFNDDFDVVGFESGKLFIHPDHKLNIDYLKYHREHHYKGFNLNEN